MQSYKEIVDKAEHYLAIGSKDVYLSKYHCIDFPWEFVTKVTNGNTYRNNMAVAMDFEAEHPCGLTFDWSVDIEPFEANGSPTLKIDIPLLRTIKEQLPQEARSQFAELLVEIRKGIMLNATQYQKAADDQCKIANGISLIINSLG